MLDYKTKQDLKSYLIEKQNITSEWDFEKTHTYCTFNNVDFNDVLKEAIMWQNIFGNGNTSLTDKDLPYTIL